MYPRAKAIFVASATAALVASACGKNDNFVDADLPQLQIDGVGFIQIEMPPDESRTESQDALILRNAGDAPLTFSKFEWIDQPDRLVALGERSDRSCASDDECNTDEICLTSTSTCISTALPSTPFEIEPQLRRDIDFAITVGPTELACPEPSIEVPPQYQEIYCGALRIETNAQNDFSDIVTDGKAIVYFTDPGASGNIQAEPSFLEFANVQPGTSHSQSFSITNVGSEDLEVMNISPEDYTQFFTIGATDGSNLPFTIGSGQAKVIDINIEIPANEDDYEVLTIINIQSSAGLATVAVEISADAGSAPVIDIDQEVLRFDGSPSQTLTITNTGQATLQLNNLNVNPGTASPFYTLDLEGTDVTNGFGGENIPKGESRALTVNFARPGGNMDPSVGVLEIAHNDASKGFSSSVTLLGDEGDVPIAQLSPQAFTFLAADGNSESRTFVVRNVGTAPLDITDVMWNFSTGSNAEFMVSPTTGTVPAGGLMQATVSFTGMNGTPDVGLATLVSNHTTPIELSIRALDSAAERPLPVIAVDNQGALVPNAPVQLNCNASTPAGSASRAIWSLLSRPASSTVWFDGVGETASFTPDVAGTYTVAVTILQNDREGQATMDIVVTE